MKKIVFKFLLSLFMLNVILFAFVAMSLSIVQKKNQFLNKHRDKYNIVLSTKYSFVDKGFSQQTVEGVCKAFNIKERDCNSSHKLFKEGKIGFGYPGTMDNISLIKDYIDNFIETEKVNYFITPGFTYTAFLQKWVLDNREYFQSKKINFIAVGTSLSSSDWPTNFWQLLFKEYLSGYYAGLYAGAYALIHPDKFKDGNPDKKGKQIHFAALGGLWIPPIVRYVFGFKLGLNKINQLKDQFTDKPNEVDVLFTKYDTIGGFDTTKYSQQTKFTAAKWFRSGVSVIFSIAVSLTKAIHTAALEADTQSNTLQHWVVGVDIDQGVIINNESTENTIYRGKILVSATLKIKERLADLIKKIKNGKYSGKNIIIEKGEYLSIPERFKKTTTWKRVRGVLENEPKPTKESMDLLHEWLVKLFLETDNAKKKSFSKLIQKFLNDSKQTFWKYPSSLS